MSLSVAAVMGSHVHNGLPCLGAWDNGYPVCLKLMFPKRKIVVSSWGVLCEVCAPCLTWIYRVRFMKCNWKVKPWLWSCNIFNSWFSLTSTWEPYMLLRYFKRFFFIGMNVLLVFLSGNVADDECWLCDVSVNKHSSWSISSKRPKPL